MLIEDFTKIMRDNNTKLEETMLTFQNFLKTEEATNELDKSEISVISKFVEDVLIEVNQVKNLLDELEETTYSVDFDNEHALFISNKIKESSRKIYEDTLNIKRIYNLSKSSDMMIH